MATLGRVTTRTCSTAPARWLAFDTSTDTMAVAAGHGDRVATVDAPGGALASASLIDTAIAQLASVGLSLRDLDVVAFGRGPGAFTGLRTACAVAQGIALGAAIPVLPIDSLLIVADDALHQCGEMPAQADVHVMVDARMGEVYAGAYRWAESRWQVLQVPRLCDPRILASEPPLPPGAIVAGSALTAIDGLQDALRARGAALMLLPQVVSRSAALQRLLHAAWAAGDAVDAADALPIYLRDKVALTTDERAAAQAGRSVRQERTVRR
jgi:tRNA threonylcarbamoyladenosine biosynthesis protein TsaB